MQSGDRVMVLDGPGFPVDHYIYATVLIPSSAGAQVAIDHPGNLSHGVQRFVAADKILRRGGAEHLAAQLRENAKKESEPGRRQHLIEHAKGMEFIAESLAE